MTQCLFCKFVHRDLQTKEAYRDDDVLAFYDINPQAPTHLLLIPTTHLTSVNEATVENSPLLGKLFSVAHKLAVELGFAESGYRLVVNTGADAGQTVFHLHMHLLAGRDLQWPPG
jgi:histidine triad (HIT) family protein